MPDQAGAALDALLEAASCGALAQVAACLDAQPQLLDQRGGEGARTALHQAAMHGHTALVRELLERGADPNIRCGGDNAFPLHFAAEKEHFDIIRLLVEHGASTRGAGDMHGLDILGWATCFGAAQPGIVAYLLAHGAEHNILSAVATGALDEIRSIVARRPDQLERVMDRDNQRRRPLHLAVVKRRADSLSVLLELGADPAATDAAALTALDEAALRGESAMAQTLLEHAAPLHLPAAIALGRHADVERLMAADPACLQPGGRWATLIVRAAAVSSAPVIEALLKLGAAVNQHDDPATSVDGALGYTPLHAAAFSGNAAAARVLLAHGAGRDAVDSLYDATPAGWAEYSGHADVAGLIRDFR